MANTFSLKALAFLFLCIRVSSEDLLVSLSSSNAYSSLTQALQALITGNTLPEAKNTIIVDSSCLSVPQAFPDIQIQGTTSGQGSISIIYGGLGQNVSQIIDCDNLPVLNVNESSPISLDNMSSFSLSGFNVVYTGIGAFASISNVENVIFSNFCFTNTEPTPLSTSNGNFFNISGVLHFSMANVVYIYDANKQLLITQTSQITIVNITVVVTSATVDSSNAAILISNNEFYNTNSNITSMNIVCQNTTNLPGIVWASQINSTWMSSLEVSNCTFLSSQSNDNGLFSSTCSYNFEVDGALIQFLSYTGEILTSFGTSTTTFNNFEVDTLNLPLGGAFINLTTSTCAEREPLTLSFSNLTLRDSQFISAAFAYVPAELNDDTFASIGGINFTNVTLWNNSISNSAAFFDYYSGTSNTLSTEANLQYIKFEGLNVINNQISQSFLILLLEDTEDILYCIESKRLEISDFNFVNNSITNAGTVIQVNDAFTSIINLTAETNIFYGSNFFLAMDSLSSFFLSNSSIKNLTLLSSSYFISADSSLPAAFRLETCYSNESSGEDFAQVRPFIIYNTTFSSVNLQPNSALLNSNNPNIVIQGNNFNQMILNSSNIINFGDPVNFFSSELVLQNFYTGPLIYQQRGKITIFTVAEESLFIDDKFLYQLYQTTRTDLAQKDPQSAVFFISIIGNLFDTINATNNSNAVIILENFQLPNSSMNISGNIFTNVTSDTAYNLISVENLAEAYFNNHLVANTTIQGYFISYISLVVSNVLLDSNIISDSQKLGLYDLQGTQCSNILIQNNQASKIESQQVFINVACNTMAGGLMFQNNTFKSILTQNAPNVIDTLGFIAVATAQMSNQEYYYMFKDLYFYDISLQNSQGFDAGRFQGSFLFISSAQASVEFLNTSFDLISVYPTGSVMEIFIPNITLLNSSFKNLIFESADGAFNLVFENLTISGCVFNENSGVGFDSTGILRLYNPDPMSDVIYVTIQNSTFSNNSAPYGTILYIKGLSIQLTVNTTNILNNQLSASGGIFYFSGIYSSNITVVETNITQTNNDAASYPQLSVFAFDESDANFEIFNCNLKAAGLVIGDFIYVTGITNIVSVFGNNLSYAAEPSPITLLTPQFGLFQGENFNAIFLNLGTSELQLDVTAIFTINCNPSTQSANYVCNFELQGSIFRDLTLNSSIISINPQTSYSSAPLAMLSLLLQNTSFSGITWLSTATSSGVISSLTSLVGRKQGEEDFAIKIENCTFYNLTGDGGLVYNAVESMYDLVLWFNNNTVNSAIISGTGGVILASGTQVATFQSSLASNSPRNVSYLLTQNNFSYINSQQAITAGSGRIIYWNSQVRGISISLQNNRFSNVNCSGEDGAVVYASYNFNLTSVLTSSGLSLEYMVIISSKNNSYEYLYAQNGAVVSSRGDTQLLQISFQNDSMKYISCTQNGGIVDLEYNSSSTTAIMSSLRLLDSLQASHDQTPQLRRELDLSADITGTIIIFNCTLANISATNGGCIYEKSPAYSTLINVMSNNFSSLSASKRGGAFWVNQPNLLVSQNIFSYISAGLAGTIFYSVSNEVNISNLAADNVILHPSTTSLISYGPTNLRVVLISIVNNNITLSPQSDKSSPSYPMFSNLTSYSLSQYLISITLVSQQDQNDYEIVVDESSNYLLDMTFYSKDNTKGQTIASSNCSDSTCSVLASAVILKGFADDVINVSVTYSSDIFNQSQNFSIGLRSCIAGEINDTTNQECQLCKVGTYSLNTNDSICQACPKGATCNGGSSISIKPAYYRSMANNSFLLIVPCNDSGTQCLGGDYQTVCSDAYLGVVCSQCNFQNGFLASGKSGVCDQCYDKTKLVSFAVLLVVVSVLYQVVMIMVTYNENKNIHAQYLSEKTQEKEGIQQNRAFEGTNAAAAQEEEKEEEIEGMTKKKKQQQKQSGLKPGALIVIFSTFAQISSVLVNFDVGIASTLINVSVSVVNSNDLAVFSLQCLYMLVTSDLFEDLRFEILVYVLSPIVKIGLVASFELLLNLTCMIKNRLGHHHPERNEHSEGGGEEERTRDEHQTHNEQTITTTKAAAESSSSAASPPTRGNASLIRIGAVAVVLFLLEQPGIVSKLCQYLTCTQLDPYAPNYYIKSRNNIQCYTPQYNSFLGKAIIPALIFWAFVVPLAIFFILYFKKKQLFESKALIIVLGNFYSPYPKQTFYWGIVIIIFKMSIFVLDAILTSSLTGKGIILMLVIHVYFMLFKRIPPYSHEILNRAEKYCSWAYMIVLTMVLIEMSFESVILGRFCEVMILVCMVGAGGYVLVNVFWLYIMKAMNILQKIKEMKRTREISRETLAHLHEFHRKLASSNTQNANLQKRRFGISLNLPTRLRRSNLNEINEADSEYKTKERLYAIQPKKFTPYILDNSLISINSDTSLIQDTSKAEDIEMPKIQRPEEEEKQVDSASFQKRIDLTFWSDLTKDENPI